MADDFLSLISSIPSLVNDFSGSANPYGSQQRQLGKNALNASNALSQGPSNPLYQSIYGQYKQQSANQMGQQIAEAQGQNRMNANMGRTPLFSNERGSENIFRTLMQQQQGAGLQADQQTRAALGQGATTALQGQAGYNAMIPQTNAATAQGQAGYNQIFNLMRGSQQPTLGNTGGTGSAGAGNYGATGSGGYNTNYNPMTSFMQSQPGSPYAGMNYSNPNQQWPYQ